MQRRCSIKGARGRADKQNRSITTTFQLKLLKMAQIRRSSRSLRRVCVRGNLLPRRFYLNNVAVGHFNKFAQAVCAGADFLRATIGFAAKRRTAMEVAGRSGATRGGPSRAEQSA